MPTNSTVPETDPNAFLSEEEKSLSAGNKWLGAIVGMIAVLAVMGYMSAPDGSGSQAIASVMPSVMLGETSVTGSRPAEEVAPAVAAVTTAPETTEPIVAAVAPRARVRPQAEMSLDSRQVQALATSTEPVAQEAAPAITASEVPTTLTLTGRIIDENGRPLAGATVLLKGSRKGTGTDANGNYSLEVPSGDNALVYGYGGYQDQEMHVRSAQPVTVTLLPAEGAKRRRK